MRLDPSGEAVASVMAGFVLGLASVTPLIMIAIINKKRKGEITRREFFLKY